MKSISLAGVLALPLLLGVASTATGHSGEVDSVPPPPPIGRPGPTPGGAPNPGGGLTGGPTTPGGGTTGGPTTPRSGPGKGPSTGQPRSPDPFNPNRRSAPASSGPATDHWSFWWFVNRRRFLTRSERQGAITPGGANQRGSQRSTTPPVTLWRAEAQRALAAALGDPDEEVAASAAVALGKGGDSSHASLLSGVLSDRARRQTEREAAALGLGLLASVEDATATRKALTDVAAADAEPTRLRAIAVYALGLRGEQDSVPFLLEAMSRREAAWDVPAAATVALGSVGDDIVRGDLEAVLAGGRRVDRVQRVYAAQALVRSGGPQSVPALTRAAFDDDPHVRRAAYLALGALAPDDNDGALDTLVRAVHREKNAGARDAAAIALGGTGHARADAALWHAYEKGNTQHQRFAALALGLLARERGDPDVATRLQTDLRDRANADLRGALAIALGIARREAAGPLLREIASSRGDPVLRAHAALAIGLAGDAGGVDALVRIVREERDVTLRSNAATALGLLGDRSAVPLLGAEMKGNESVFVQGSAAIALGRIGGADAARTLASVLEDGSRAEVVRSAAAIALGLLLDPDHGTRLAEVGTDLDWTTLTTTVYELLQIQ